MLICQSSEQKNTYQLSWHISKQQKIFFAKNSKRGELPFLGHHWQPDIDAHLIDHLLVYLADYDLVFVIRCRTAVLSPAVPLIYLYYHAFQKLEASQQLEDSANITNRN